MVNEEMSNNVLEIMNNSNIIEESESIINETKSTEQNLSKRQLKRLKKTEKWIQRKSEKR